MKRDKLSRRVFLGTALTGTVVTAAAPAAKLPQRRSKNTAKYSDYLVLLNDDQSPTDATADNIEGPFYRPDAPFRTNLLGKGDKGQVLIVSGTVVSRNGRPLADAVVEVWQADAQGRYDNDDPAHPPAKNEFRLRGQLKTDKEGKYQFETIRPAAYRIGPRQFRPAHIHVKVHKDGYRSLTTQLYFKDDAYNKTDPWYKKSLVVDFTPDDKDKKAQRGTFRFVLAKA